MKVLVMNCGSSSFKISVDRHGERERSCKKVSVKESEPMDLY